MARLKNIIEKTLTVATIGAPANGDAIDVSGVSVFSAACVIDVNTPAAKVFTADPATEIFTAAAHGFPLGLKIQVSNGGGGLPAGLVAVTDYFVIPLTADTFQLATSLALAQAGTYLSITTAGTGTQTATPVALAGGTVKLQKSNDNSNWADEGSATNVTADATVFLEKVDPAGKYMRIVYTLTAGSLSASNVIVGKGVDG